MPRTKGCTCGTPPFLAGTPCRVHPDRIPGGRDAPPTPSAGTSEEGADVGRIPIDFSPSTADQFGNQSGTRARDTGAGSGKKRPDPVPKPRKPRKPAAPDKPDDAALVAMLGELLTMPAIPAAVLWHCDYCRDHFINEGPKASRELVALSMTNPALRGALESLYAGWSKITIAGVLAGYLAKPLMHHVAPEPVLAAAGPVLGVPPRPPKPEAHAHATDPQAEHEGDGAAPAEHESDGPAAAEDQPPRDPATGLYAA